MRDNDNRRGFSNNIIVAIAAGFLLGIAALFAKLAMSEVSLLIIISPIAWMALLLAVAGFLLMQFALQGYVSKIMPIITGVSIIVAIVLAFIFLTETIAFVKWLGIFLVLAGVFGLTINNEKY